MASIKHRDLQQCPPTGPSPIVLPRHGQQPPNMRTETVLKGSTEIVPKRSNQGIRKHSRETVLSCNHPPTGLALHGRTQATARIRAMATPVAHVAHARSIGAPKPSSHSGADADRPQ
jgi:hypothetical protein